MTLHATFFGAAHNVTHMASTIQTHGNIGDCCLASIQVEVSMATFLGKLPDVLEKFQGMRIVNEQKTIKRASGRNRGEKMPIDAARREEIVSKLNCQKKNRSTYFGSLKEPKYVFRFFRKNQNTYFGSFFSRICREYRQMRPFSHEKTTVITRKNSFSRYAIGFSEKKPKKNQNSQEKRPFFGLFSVFFG